MIRGKVWATLVNVKFKGYLLGYLVEHFQKWDRGVNIFLAVASSGSIAAWAVWQEVPMLWAGIIALSQVVNVIKPYFPYYKYVKELNAKCLRCDSMNIEFERLWGKMQSGKITDEAAEEAYYDLRKQMVELFNFGDDTIFDVGDKMEGKANKRMKIFFESNYGVTINI